MPIIVANGVRGTRTAFRYIGVDADVDVEVFDLGGDLAECLCNRATAEERYGRLIVRELGDTGVWVPFAPLAIHGDGGELRRASMTVQHVRWCSEIGELSWHDRFDDGGLIERTLGVVEDPHLVIQGLYDDMLEFSHLDKPLEFMTERTRLLSKNPNYILLAVGLYCSLGRWAPGPTDGQNIATLRSAIRGLGELVAERTFQAYAQ